MRDIEKMTKAELVDFIKSGGMLQPVEDEPEWDNDDPAPELFAAPMAVRTVTVADTFKVDIDPKRLTSWRFVSLMAKAQDPDKSDAERLPALVELAEYILGDSMGAALDYLGGPDVANVADVAKLAFDIVTAAAEAKN